MALLRNLCYILIVDSNSGRHASNKSLVAAQDSATHDDIMPAGIAGGSVQLSRI